MLLILAFCSLVATAMVVTNRRNPGAQASRRAGLNAHDAQPGRTPEDVDWIVENKFLQVVRNAAWRYHPAPLVIPNDPDSEDGNVIPDTHTIETRLKEGLTWLKTALQVCPSDLIVHDEELRGKSHFTRTESAFLNGLVAIIAVRIVYGRTALFRHDTQGGMVDHYCRDDFSGNLLRTLVVVIFETMNVENHKGWVLNLSAIKTTNYGNFMKNMVKRGKEGIYSDEFVLAVQNSPDHELYGNPIMVRGLYLGYYKILCQLVRGFSKKVTQANRGAYVTAAENADAKWIAINSAVLPF